LIGLSVALYFYTTGRLAGISGIFANAITNQTKRLSNIFFLFGLVLGPLLFSFTKEPIAFNITHSYLLIITGGFLVGLGTRLSGGCTSGHGICGIGRFSVSSIIATVIFIVTGMLTVVILQQFEIYI
jgi:hypothetical protein